jgi:hypothetical protein
MGSGCEADLLGAKSYVVEAEESILQYTDKDGGWL